MFATLSAAVLPDNDYPPRTRTLDLFRRVLKGTIYDVLTVEFHEEKTPGGEYVPLRNRRPSVRYALPALVVSDTVSMLFGEGRFPAVDVEDEDGRALLADLAKELKINQVMTDAALRGSIGSVAILMRVLKDRVFLKVLETPYLTPVWKADEPDALAKVTEAYKVLGSVLRDQGYDIPQDQSAVWFWFRRMWDDVAETWYLPQAISDAKDGAAPTIDQARTVRHKLGFVPIVWIRNLPGGDDVDGDCTFRAAIDTSIEIDYQLSQAGRGLKYSSDPQLLIKEPVSDGEQVKGGGNALIVSEKGDAKLLEIGGTAAQAVVEYVATLREYALESVHGNRSSADKISAAQSGRAMELMHQPLINVTDQLRSSYGESGLLPLMRMILDAKKAFPGIKVMGKPMPDIADTARLTLKWPPWFAMTPRDRVDESAALSTLQAASMISQETAVTQVAETYDIGDVPAELARIKADVAEQDARAMASAAQQVRLEAAHGVPA